MRVAFQGAGAAMTRPFKVFFVKLLLSGGLRELQHGVELFSV